MAGKKLHFCQKLCLLLIRCQKSFSHTKKKMKMMSLALLSYSCTLSLYPPPLSMFFPCLSLFLSPLSFMLLSLTLILTPVLSHTPSVSYPFLISLSLPALKIDFHWMLFFPQFQILYHRDQYVFLLSTFQT